VKYDHLPPGLVPIFLRRSAAAAFWGVSESTFDRMVEEGHAPRPARFGKIVLWFRPALVASAARLSGVKMEADSAASPSDGGNEWDAVLK